MSAEVGIEAHIDLGSKLDSIHGLMSRKALPIFRPQGGSNSGAAPLTVEISQTVPPGRIWNLLGLGIFGADGHTVLASAVTDVYKAASGVELPDFSCQIFTGLAVPTMGWQSKEVIWIEPGERIVAIVYGFAATAQVSLIAHIADYRIEDKEALST